jgi:hypothetical protein
MSRQDLTHLDMLGILIFLGGLTEADVHMILRGGLTHLYEDDPPCQAGRRDVYQIGLRPPLGPVKAGRDRLACPYQERAEKGDAVVPCTTAQEGSDSPEKQSTPRARDARAAAMRIFVRKMDPFQPCEALAWLAVELLETWIRSADPGAPPEDEEVRQDLLFLIESGRLDRDDMEYLIEHGLVATDDQWFPCRGERHSHEARPRISRCPLHARARLGERTVPCREAQCVVQDDVLGSYLTHALKLDLRRYYHKDDDEGRPDPEDPVRQRMMRPCYLLGRLLASRLWPALQEMFGGELPAAASGP